MNELSLLRQYEPVVRFTHGELFFPCAVDGYVRQCSLWMHQKDGGDLCLVPAADLTLDRLALYRDVPADNTLYLRFVGEPLDPLEYQRWLRRPERPIFLAPGRLARVGLVSRILDSFFDLSLLVRGTVPGGTTAAAEVGYRAIQRADPRRVYYGRVVRDGGYTILNYLFFYAMNDWRTTFYGVNDHEADWEQIFVFLADDPAGTLQPQWLAYAAHDYRGDDLRRRWDDPAVEKVDGTHPVVYVGAGSHACHFEPGEYMMNAEPGAFRPIKNGLLAARRFWAETLQQGVEPRLGRAIDSLFRVPFVDYARGDGHAIGPRAPDGWHPVLISDDNPWIDCYRGLWGLDTKDPFSGERAPSGPKYNRDGTVRQSWYDPLGWAGLDKVMPPLETNSRLREHIRELSREEGALRQQIDAAREELRTLALEVHATEQTDYLDALHETLHKKLTEKQSALQALQARRVEIHETRRVSESYLSRLLSGDKGDPHAHLRTVHAPAPPAWPQARLAEFWAAISGGLILLVLVGLIALRPTRWFLWIFVAFFIFGGIEWGVRGRLADYLLNATIVLAIVTTVVLLWEFWWLVAVVLVAVLVMIMMRENLRELLSDR